MDLLYIFYPVPDTIMACPAPMFAALGNAVRGRNSAEPQAQFAGSKAMAALHSPFAGLPFFTALVTYWRGDGPLWRVYWLYGVLISTILAGIYATALANNSIWLQQLLLPIFVAYTGWIVVSVWRCAPNASQEIYTVLARWLTVAWAINAILLAGFLQMWLIGFYVV
jgi:hypothetical protein